MMKSPPQPLPPTGVHGVRRSGQTLQALQTNRPAAFTGSLTKAEMLQPFKQNQNQNQGIHPPAQAGEISGNDMHHLRTQQGPPPNDNGQNGHQAVEFDHAITYVTTIKKRFATEPRTYQQFLEILHTYQKEQRGIREVLEQVSSLFADHPDLLREFTYFLPEAVQEQAKERLQAAAAEAEARQAAARQRAMETSNQYPSHQFHSTTSPSTGNRGGNQEIIDMTKKVNAVFMLVLLSLLSLALKCKLNVSSTPSHYSNNRWLMVDLQLLPDKGNDPTALQISPFNIP